jgi:hypothetical protein
LRGVPHDISTTSQRELVDLVAGDLIGAAMDRSSRDRKHRFDFLSKTIPRRTAVAHASKS